MTNFEADTAAAELWDRRPESIDELLSLYRGLCERAAWRRADSNPYVDADEYVAAAEAACWDAIRRFDPHNAKGATASTFILWRVKGAIVEAERANDWVKPKVRAAARDGLIDLPAMHRMNAAFDKPVNDAEPDAGERLGELFGRADSVVRALAERMVAAGHDAVDLAQRLGCSPEFAGMLSRWTIDELRGTPCPA